MSGAPLAGFPVTAPPLPPPVFTRQHWGDLTFVHWPVDPATVAHMHPAGTRPDVFTDGMTYVGLVPFAMSDVALAVSRPIPYFGRFLETNVRLYSTDDAGRHGVLFRSLAPTPLEVWLTARWGAHTRKAGRTWWVPNEHVPFPLRAAEVVELDEDLVAAAGVRPAGGRLRALYSPGVRASFGRPAMVTNG